MSRPGPMAFISELSTCRRTFVLMVEDVSFVPLIGPSHAFEPHVARADLVPYGKRVG